MHALHNTARDDAQAAPTQLCCKHDHGMHTRNQPSAGVVGCSGASFEHMHASCSACHVANLLPTTTERPGYIQRCCQIWAACTTPRPHDWRSIEPEGEVAQAAAAPA
jgi:hypothetical protein